MNTISCGCGQAKLYIEGPALLRMLCHCTICQTFNRTPVGDLVIFRGRDVQVHSGSRIEYQRLRKPPAVDRGRCGNCGQPTLEYLNLPLCPKLAFVPSALLAGHIALPPASMRAFYDRRSADVDDDLPRYEGYWPSQLAMLKRILPALWR